ncbi:hypothetical protein [Mycetocola spongiae]|uniref:hypothetical protein n=1 Tax=Mycetocola spongiae TaxID=2859226 RepID=UPI001CF435B8|nr:hypothetical protein [Mycetocola spongiae]UCR87905.1 hypothetical protein KXZ72_07695 [Mycetocola spongiae]
MATALSNSPDSFIGARKIARRLGVVMPNWRFFGPNPGTNDYHLLYRFGRRNCPLTQWVEVPTAVPRGWNSLFWNPGSRGPKAVFDCCQTIVLNASTQNNSLQQATDSAAFQAILQFIETKTPVSDAEEIQVMILSTIREDDVNNVSPMLITHFMNRSRGNAEGDGKRASAMTTRSADTK